MLIKKLILLATVILVSCGPTKQDEIDAADKTATLVSGPGLMHVKIKTVVHENKRYIVACYGDGVCIIPEPKD